MAHHVSVFIENKLGHFERVTNILKKSGISIRTMTLSNSSSGWGILNLLVSDPFEAFNALSGSGFSAALREVIALEMEDKSGGLDDLLIKIAQAGISFDNAFGRVLENDKKAILVIDVPDIQKARILLAAAGLSEPSDDLVYGTPR